MLAGLPVAITLLFGAAQTAAADLPPASVASVPPPYGPAAPSPPRPTPKPPEQRCPTAGPPPDPREIVICAQRPEGYRLDPDLVEARRELKSGRPRRPENFKDHSCSSIGPMGCGPQAGINLVGAALTAAEMAARLAKGQEIGSMFVTDPHPTEYQLYLEAKQRREAKEAVKAAKAKAAAQAQDTRPAHSVDPQTEQQH